MRRVIKGGQSRARSGARRLRVETSLGVNQNYTTPTCYYGIAGAHSLPLPHSIAPIRQNEFLLFIEELIGL
jgi:hypothetical protein